MNVLKWFCSVILVALASVQTNVAAQDAYPSRPITMIVPFAPGNATDSIARMVGERLSRALKQPVVIENRPGASGGIGMATLAKAAPDGYTIGVSAIGPMALNPALYSKLAYDPQKGFSIISVFYRAPYLFLVNADSPILSLKDLVQTAQSQPNGLFFASPGTGSLQHITGELFARTAIAQMVHVPNAGSGQASTLLLGKNVPVLIDNASVGIPFVRSGQMRALAITSSKRLSALANVPTTAEAGYPGVVTEGWLCLVAPAGVDEHVLNRLSLELRKIAGSEEMQAFASTLGGFPETMDANESAKYVRAETVRWAEVIRAAKIKLD